MLKADIVEMAKKAYDLLKESITQSQVKKYMSVVRGANNLEEYIIFLRYQMRSLARKNKDAVESVIEHVRKIAAGNDFEKSKGDIGYYFGTISRLIKIGNS